MSPRLPEAVVLHWEEVADAPVAENSRLPPAVADLLAAGVDVVLTAPSDPGSHFTGTAQDGPGRLFVWATGASEVRQAGSPDRWPVTGVAPQEWVRRHLSGPGGPPPLVFDHADPGAAGAAETATLRGIAGAATELWEVTDDPAWRFEAEGVEPDRHRHFEGCLSIGNGRTGTRGSVEEGHPDSLPALYVAGVFGLEPGRQPVPDLIRGPEWTSLRPRAGGEQVDASTGETLLDRRVLDLRHGTLSRHWRQRLPSGEQWEFRSLRFASIDDRRLLVLEARATTDGSAVTLVGDVPVPPDQPAVESVETRQVAGADIIVVRGRHGGGACFGVATSGSGPEVRRLVTVERMLPRASGPDDDCVSGAAAALGALRDSPTARLLARHRRAWRQRWRDADVVVEGDAGAQRALRFALYHLISSGDPESDMASIGARGLSGPGYRGHVFWDTEVYVLPFFTWTHPPTARALLAYRYRTLPAAKAKAAAMGYAGALFAWESADTGEECTPDRVSLPNGVDLEVLTGQQEHHISADVAWAVWQHWQVTGDDEFLTSMGAEIIVETARFWASRTEPGPGGRRHIRKVIGPDEYHETVDDSAFTNVMARWNLRTAARLRRLLPSWDSLAASLGVSDDEVSGWERLASDLVDGFSPDSLLYEQFAGFFALEDVRAVDLAPRPFTGELVVGTERLRGTQVVKQADVVLLSRMVPEEVGADVARANYRYYEPRTSHGSSLSPAMHALVAARVGEMDHASAYFTMASGIDLDDRKGNAAQGVHVATMGGLWQAAVMGFGGVSGDAGGGVLRIDPRPCPSWERLAFPIRWRGRRVQVEVEGDELLVHLEAPTMIAAGRNRGAELGPGTFVSRSGEGEGERWSQLAPFGEGGRS